MKRRHEYNTVSLALVLAASLLASCTSVTGTSGNASTTFGNATTGDGISGNPTATTSPQTTAETDVSVIPK